MNNMLEMIKAIVIFIVYGVILIVCVFGFVWILIRAGVQTFLEWVNGY